MSVLDKYDPPCWTCDWTKEGYHADSATNCRDTCNRYEDYRLAMLAQGIEVVG